MRVIKKERAFTLTELLVVVIVIGVLAAVVLPKYSKVMETRKTTEAEELMAAVRTEQEKRCMLDENYLTDLSDLSDIIPSVNTKNFVYRSNQQGTGIEAQSKGKYSYTLKMPSYADGRLCCENEEQCSKLNKDYPLCSDLIARADYQSGAECAGESVPEVPAEKDCTGAKPAESQLCNECGTQTRTVKCDTSTGNWVVGAWSQCDKTPEECGEHMTCGEWSYQGQFADYWCDIQFGQVYNPAADNFAISKDASPSDIGACCTGCPPGQHATDGLCCPADKVAGRLPNGEWGCVDCADLGSNFFMDQNGECRERFQLTPVSLTMVYGNFEKYAHFQANNDLCNYSYTGTRVNTPCLVDNLQNMCRACDANSDTCTVSCYDTDSAQEAQDDLSTVTYFNASAQKGTCSARTSGFQGGSITTGYNLAGFIGDPASQSVVSQPGSHIYWSDLIGASCSSCGQKSSRIGVGVTYSCTTGNIEGNASQDVCFYPKTKQIRGYVCEAQ